MKKIFIDGGEGTTGLCIFDRFKNRSDVRLLSIDPDLRKDPSERKRLLNEADIVFLCLPDAAAREAVVMVENTKTRVIDASTAHRTNPGWVYGLPELSPKQRESIKTAERVAVPGCHATGLVVLAYPLLKMGILSSDYPVVCHSLTGYSGGGKSMIADYLAPGRAEEYSSPRQYGLNQKHKHLPEMQYICGLSHPPAFCPAVSDYYAGMTVTLPLFKRLLSKKMTVREIHAALSDYYKNEYFVRVGSFCGETELPDGYLAANTLAGSNNLRIFVCGNDDTPVLTAQFDNLGKGSSGAAVQCMNIMLGLDERTGL